LLVFYQLLYSLKLLLYFIATFILSLNVARKSPVLLANIELNWSEIQKQTNIADYKNLLKNFMEIASIK
jgi:hypothetical protein